MSTLKWVDGLSQAPTGRKRTKPEQRHSAEEWESWMPRARELYKEHTLHNVRQILEDEGFVASEKQLKDRLSKDSVKYLKLPESQWQSVGHKAFVRWQDNPEKRIAFRLRDPNSCVLPSAKIRRGLEERFKKPSSSSGFSVMGTISSRNISAYTSESHGFEIRGSLLLNFESRAARLRASPSAGTRSCTTTDVPLEDLLSPHLEHEWTPNQSFRGSYNAIRTKYPDDRFYVSENSSANLHNSYIKALKIVCLDCPRYEFMTTVKERIEPLVLPLVTEMQLQRVGEVQAEPMHFTYPSAFTEFEQTHLLHDHHVQRVKLRLLYDEISCVYPGVTRRWKGRADFTAETGITCGHDIPPRRYDHESDSCFRVGGCRWSEFKAAEEINAIYMLAHRPQPNPGVTGGVASTSDIGTDRYGEREETPEFEIEDYLRCSVLGSEMEYQDSVVEEQISGSTLQNKDEITIDEDMLDLSDIATRESDEIIHEWLKLGRDETDALEMVSCPMPCNSRDAVFEAAMLTSAYSQGWVLLPIDPPRATLHHIQAGLGPHNRLGVKKIPRAKASSNSRGPGCRSTLHRL